jgi:hypothetical protein
MSGLSYRLPLRLRSKGKGKCSLELLLLSLPLVVVGLDFGRPVVHLAHILGLSNHAAARTMIRDDIGQVIDIVPAGDVEEVQG